MKTPLLAIRTTLIFGLALFSPIVFSLGVEPFCATPKIIDEYLTSKGYIFKPEFSACNKTKNELEPSICTLTYFPTPSAISEPSASHKITLSTLGIQIALVTEYPIQTKGAKQKSCLEKNSLFISPDQIRSNADYFQRLQNILNLKSQNKN